jgi:hypothetical protein
MIAWKCILVRGYQWKQYRLVFNPELYAIFHNTKASRYDQEAIQIVVKWLIPLVFVYATYTLIFSPFSSFFDYLISLTVATVYGLGFISLLPQVIINHRLKSVAQLPWTMLSYRFFNTIIDDIFAMIIRMPTLHRVAVFRDDIVFIIYVIQRWIYPVDTSRSDDDFEGEEKVISNRDSIQSVDLSESENELALSHVAKKKFGKSE